MERISKDQEADMDLLKSIIEDQLRININERNRKRPIVDGRMVFAKILFDLGYRHSTIACYMKKDRTTVIHYVDTCDNILLHDSMLMNRYSKVKESFYETRKVTTNIIVESLNEKTLDLNKKIDNLMRQIHRMGAERKKLDRIMPIINLIEQKTKRGQEEFVRKKINQLFNDLWET